MMSVYIDSTSELFRIIYASSWNVVRIQKTHCGGPAELPCITVHKPGELASGQHCIPATQLRGLFLRVAI
jgi:hypothetical protein